MKKGFTLVELLAVIVILAIIALIAVPQVLNIINEAKAKADTLSYENILRALKLHHSSEEMEYGSVTKLNFNCNGNNCVITEKCIEDEGCISYDEENQKVVEEIKGNVPDGTIILYKTDDGNFKIEEAIYLNNLCFLNGNTVKLPKKYCMFETPEDCFTMNTKTGAITRYNCGVGNTNGMPEITDLVIPEKVNGIIVKSINTSVFSNKGLTSVDLSKAIGLQSMQTGVFSKNSIKKVTFGQLPELTSIPLSTFESNQITGELDLSGLTGITSIALKAFVNNQITSIKFGNISNLQTIGGSAFGNNSISGELDLSGLSGLNKIDSSAFQKNQITSVKFGNLDNLETIGSNAFSSNKIEKVTFGNMPMLNTIYSSAFYMNQVSGTLDLSGCTSLITIDYRAFRENNISKIILPSSITTIGNEAFLGNSNIERIVNKSNNGFNWPNFFDYRYYKAYDEEGIESTSVVTGTLVFNNTRTIYIVAN